MISLNMSATVQLHTTPRMRHSRTSTPLANEVQVKGSNSLPVPFIETPKLNKTILQLQQDKDHSMNESLQEIHASYLARDEVSPMLAKLRMTPGRLLKEKQLILVKKHEQTKQKVDSLNVGGGISIWPNMENMRLTQKDLIQLALGCLVICTLAVRLFYKLHGSTLTLLLEYHSKVKAFHRNHVIQLTTGQREFDQSLLVWHTDYRDLIDHIRRLCDVSKVPVSYVLYILTYCCCIAFLIYYLVDNMFAKSKLSPKRIRKWVTLLCLVGTWTGLMVFLMVSAYKTELAIERNVYHLTETLADAVIKDLNCDKLTSLLTYWSLRCLPPTTPGTITILGVVSIRDLIYYLSYYSLAIVTVLVVPVCKLLISLFTVYNVTKS